MKEFSLALSLSFCPGMTLSHEGSLWLGSQLNLWPRKRMDERKKEEEEEKWYRARIKRAMVGARRMGTFPGKKRVQKTYPILSRMSLSFPSQFESPWGLCWHELVFQGRIMIRGLIWCPSHSSPDWKDVMNTPSPQPSIFRPFSSSVHLWTKFWFSS